MLFFDLKLRTSREKIAILGNKIKRLLFFHTNKFERGKITSFKKNKNHFQLTIQFTTRLNWDINIAIKLS